MKGLYVHIPFCIKKCAYCDFNSFCASDITKEKYIASMKKEMAEYKGTEVDTVYIGGGTPTTLTTAQLADLIDNVKRNFRLLENTEFTVEMNPKTADIKKLELLLKMGVNRLSIGVQSFCDNELSALGRIHTASDAVEAISLARKAGFQNVSIDLMCAIPYQTMESLRKTIATAISQKPDHISCYSLILEEGTPLFYKVKSGEISLCDEDTERKMYEYAVFTLEKNGYKQYEISNFAKDGKMSRHNIKYWTMEEYIGIGLSAHSMLCGKRYANTRDIDKYNLGYFREESTDLSEKDMMSEFMFLGLRMTEGVSENDFFEKFGKNIFDVFSAPLEKFIKTGFLIYENGKIRLSKEAVSVSNSIMCEFLL